MGAFSLLITTPLGYIISFIYDLVQNYGFAIIIFTLIVKLIMLPLVIKQQKSTVQMQKIQPEMQAIQKKYANDQQRLSQETMKLYKKYNISPAGGCLPLLIQLPIIFGLYQVITRPMQYILHMGTDLIQKVADVLKDAGHITESVANFATKQQQITVASSMADNLAFVEEKVGTALSTLNFDFFGLDLSLTPQLSQPSILWVIPILSAVTAYISGQITTKLSGNQQAAEQMKTMHIMMPLMSGYFCFIMPTGVGLYWVMSNVVQMVQQIVVTKIMLKKDKEA